MHCIIDKMGSSNCIFHSVTLLTKSLFEAGFWIIHIITTNTIIIITFDRADMVVMSVLAQSI